MKEAEKRGVKMKQHSWIWAGIALLLSAGQAGAAEVEVPVLDTGHFWTYTMAASAEQGCYTMETSYYGSWLTYVDDLSGQEVYLCGKPDCLHAKMGQELSEYDPQLQEKLESCNAYIGDAISMSLFYSDGYVYYIGYDESTYELTLERVTGDGSVHEEIAVIGESTMGANIYSYTVADGACYLAYMPFSLETENERTAEIKKISLKDGTTETVYSYSDVYATFSGVIRSGTDIYFLEGGFDADGKSVKKLKCLDTRTEETTTLTEAGIYEYVVTEDGVVYYFAGFEGLHRFDPQTGEDELIWECQSDTEIAELCYDGSWLYLDNMITAKVINECQRTLVVLDMDGTQVNRIAMEGYQSALVNERYLLAEKTEEETASVIWCIIPHDELDSEEYEWGEIRSDCQHKRNELE